MTPARGRVKAVIDQALEIEAVAERAAYLDRECAGAPELRRQVEALLKDAGSFLEKPPIPAGVTTPYLAPPENEAERADSREAPGTRIGPYKLLQRIGEGGMGTVWMAEQQEPVRRLVALKVVKAGLDSAHVIARFEAERQALALMDHPNIARVLDAGATGTGRPYFVMELVKGVPITTYCDEYRLTPRERLELFVPVCRAVQHAHQKGIIHRDLKPSNVLVAPYDGKPVVKVIDFGVAKAAGQRLTERTLFTEFGAVVGTLEYMSPEQAELNNQDIDTRSDVYSLGVLLYELLTGTTPLTRQGCKQAPFTELLRQIREEEPPRPSTRLSSSKEALALISARRQTEPAQLTKLVRGELDWIVMKALEKDRARRYESANGLARDVERYLHDEPVEACPPSAGYRLRKLARRYRGVLVVAAVFMALLVLGAAVSTWLAVRATVAEGAALAARDEEAEQRRKADQQTEIANRRAEDLAWEDYINRVNRAYREVQEDNLALAEDLLHGCSADRRGWEWHYVKRLCKLPRLELDTVGRVNAVAFSPDGAWIASGSGVPNWVAPAETDEPAIDVWDAVTGRRRQTLRGLKGCVYDVAFSPDGRRIAVGSGFYTPKNEARLSVFDAVNLQAVWSMSEPDLTAMSVAFSPDGKSLAVGYGLRNGETAGKVKVWEVASGRETTGFRGPVGGVHKVAFSPDGQRLAVPGSGIVEVWDLRSRTKVRDFRGHNR
jgi:serine/threonine protein kinase